MCGGAASRTRRPGREPACGESTPVTVGFRSRHGPPSSAIPEIAVRPGAVPNGRTPHRGEHRTASGPVTPRIHLLRGTKGRSGCPYGQGMTVAHASRAHLSPGRGPGSLDRRAESHCCIRDSHGCRIEAGQVGGMPRRTRSGPDQQPRLSTSLEQAPGGPDRSAGGCPIQRPCGLCLPASRSGRLSASILRSARADPGRAPALLPRLRQVPGRSAQLGQRL